MGKGKVRSTSIEPLEFGQEVTLNGIEKYKESDAKGELVALRIVVWSSLSRTRKAVATAVHGEKAKLVDMKRNSRHVMNYKIEVETEEGPIQGWVMFPFLNEAVKEYYGDSDI
jgi:hypothetical protein